MLPLQSYGRYLVLTYYWNAPDPGATQWSGCAAIAFRVSTAIAQTASLAAIDRFTVDYGSRFLGHTVTDIVIALFPEFLFIDIVMH